MYFVFFLSFSLFCFYNCRPYCLIGLMFHTVSYGTRNEVQIWIKWFMTCKVPIWIKWFTFHAPNRSPDLNQIQIGLWIVDRESFDLDRNFTCCELSFNWSVLVCFNTAITPPMYFKCVSLKARSSLVKASRQLWLLGMLRPISI